MSIKSQGGVFGRNPTFNDVYVDGTLSIGGAEVPAPANTLVSSDIGSTVQAYDANTAKYDDATAPFTGNVTVDGTITADENITVDTSSSGNGLTIQSSGNTYNRITLDANRGSSGQLLGEVMGQWDGTQVAAVRLSAGSDTVNKDDGQIYFLTSSAGAVQNRMQIDQTGNVTVSTGNLVIATSGAGIDFSATGDGSGTTDNELFDDYEEGTWTPVFTSWSTTGTTSVAGTYTRVGNVVVVTGQFRSVTGSIASTGGSSTITGLPFSISGYMSFTVSPGQGATNGGVGANDGNTLYAPTISSTFNDIYFQATYHTS